MTQGGLYSAWRDRILPLCGTCPYRNTCPDFQEGEHCPQMARTMDQVYDTVTRAGHITDLSEALVREYAYSVAMLERIDSQIAAEGMLYPDPNAPGRSRASGLMDLRMRVAGRVDKGAAELGLTPSSQARAGMKAMGDEMNKLASAIDRLNESRRQGPRVVETQASLALEAEWDDDDGDDDGTDGA
jgi:hypothetical protein